ncbi:hypothetical protein FACS1894153_4700 [Bacteroidia bacterium]|nr:hypothetical protein FACS1894153_4700 [Bacteroidia bacterium]
MEVKKLYDQEVTRVFDILDNYLNKYPHQDTALACKREGEWRKYSVQEYVRTTNYISYGLMALGIKKGDKIGIVSSNRPEWNMIDMAVMQIGAISTPLYPTISKEDYTHILNHAEMTMIFIEGRELREKLTPILQEVKTLKHIYTFIKQEENIPCFDELVELGKKNPQLDILTEIKASIDKYEMATLTILLAQQVCKKALCSRTIISYKIFINYAISLLNGVIRHYLFSHCAMLMNEC